MSNLNYNERVMSKIFVSMQTLTMSDVKTCQNEHCRYFKKYKIRTITEVQPPFPSILHLGINWSSND